MRNTLLHTLSTTLALLLCVAPALAWGPTGHRIVGDLAQRQLTPQAAATVADLLRGESEPNLAGVANWADSLRQSDPARFKLTQGWHYDDFPRGDCNYVPPRDCPGGNCVIEAISAQEKILADTAQPRQARIDALKFLVHFVGDLHQPFHALGVGHGGNDVPVSVFGSETCGNYPCNLHSVWDGSLIAHRALDDAHYLQVLNELIQKNDWASRPAGGPAEWAMQSHDLGNAALVPEHGIIDESYYRAQLPIVEQRLSLAGLRLAAILNEVLTQ